MKLLILLLPWIALTLNAAPTADAKAWARCFLAADRIVIRGEFEKSEEGTVVTDRIWLKNLGRAMSESSPTRAVQCLCCGWTTVYFYKNNCEIFSLAAIHGNQLRTNGGDFPIDEDHWKIISTLIENQARTNLAQNAR